MASTEDRIRRLVDESLQIEGRSIGQALDLNANMAEAGVSSSDVVSFWKAINNEFGVRIPPEEFADLLTVQSLIDFLDSHAA